MALVSELGHEFYEVLPCPKPVSWVAQHVMPQLNQTPISAAMLNRRLGRFLNQFKTLHVIADWPEDLTHFCQALITGPGTSLAIPPLTLQLISVPTDSQQPHYALADARALRDALQDEDIAHG